MSESLPKIKIDQPIISSHVKKETTPPPPPALPEKFPRPKSLHGITYKIKPATIDCAMYVTINHTEMEDGSLRPLELFINSKHTQHYQWIVALTRMVSAVFRKPGEIEFAIKELEEVFDPTGGYWHEGDMMPSIVAHVGRILREHCESIGVLKAKQLTQVQQEVIQEKVEQAKSSGVAMQLCNSCNKEAAIYMDGCLTCTACGESKCG